VDQKLWHPDFRSNRAVLYVLVKKWLRVILCNDGNIALFFASKFFYLMSLVWWILPYKSLWYLKFECDEMLMILASLPNSQIKIPKLLFFFLKKIVLTLRFI
jgi:hypothetical protein